MDTVALLRFGKLLLASAVLSFLFLIAFSLWFAFHPRDDKAILTWAVLIVGLGPAPLSILLSALSVFVQRFRFLVWVALPFAVFPISIASFLIYALTANSIYLIRP